MSYDVQLFRTETMTKEQQSKEDNFFGQAGNLVPFTADQKQSLHERLLEYNYLMVKQEEGTTWYEFKDGLSISVMLTNNGLYFQTAWNQEGIFEIGMTASEFTDTAEFVKYDPQNGGWEEIE
jgi:hypothetical protein